MKLYVLTQTSKAQAEKAIQGLKLGWGAKEILKEVNRRRNSKQNCHVYFKVRTMAKELRRSDRTVRRYIKEAEEAGYLLVFDQIVIKEEDKAPRIINNHYYLSSGLANAADLPKILALPSRPSKISQEEKEKKNHRGYFVVSRRPLVLKGDCHTPPDKNDRSNLPILNIDNNYITTRQTQPVTPIEPKEELRGSFLDHLPEPHQIERTKASKPETLIQDAKEVLRAYTRHFRPPGQRTRAAFMEEFIEGGSNKESLLDALDKIVANPDLKSSTTSPNRLFYSQIMLKIAKKKETPFKMTPELNWGMPVNQFIEDIGVTEYG